MEAKKNEHRDILPFDRKIEDHVPSTSGFVFGLDFEL